MIFTSLFIFLSCFSLILGINDYGFSLLKLLFQNVNWNIYEPTTCRDLAYYFSFVFGYLSFSTYKYEYLKGESISENIVAIYKQKKLVFFNRIKNPGFTLSYYNLTFVFIILFGLLARAYKMPLVILYDEAATYLDYCDGAFTSFLKIWNVNNHLINTLLMKISIEIFGNGVIALRLPSFMFGFANHLLIYYASKQLYGKTTALISMFLYSCTPFLIHFESLARGYSSKVTFTLLLFLACFHFLQKPKKTYLVLISFISSLGFLSIFSFVFPFFGFLIWIGYELLKKKKLKKKLIINYLFLIILYTKIISIFFYAPSFILSNGIFPILKVAWSGNVNVYGHFPDGIPNFFVDLINMLFFNNTLLAVIVFLILCYTILKEDKLKSLLVSQFVSAIIIFVAVSAIFPSRIFIYTIPFIIIPIAFFISKALLSIKKVYFYTLPIFQMLIYLYFFKNNIVENYHGHINDGIVNVIEKLKTLNTKPSKSRVLLIGHPGLYKSFKYYHRVNNLPTIEMYAGSYSFKDDNFFTQTAYIIALKDNGVEDYGFTKVFQGGIFEIYKSKLF